MIAIDASTLINVLIDDGAAGAVARSRIRSEHRLVAPQLIDIEVLSVLRARVLRGVLDEARASQAVVELARFPLARYEHVGIVERAWQLRDALTAYDAAYVALAETLRCRLVTNDAKLAKGAEHAKSPAQIEVLTG